MLPLSLLPVCLHTSLSRPRFHLRCTHSYQQHQFLLLHSPPTNRKNCRNVACRAALPEARREVVVGIDLGTTNSAVAWIEGGKPVCIPTRDGEYVTPSVVAVLPEGEVLVGKLAKRQAVINPQSTYYSVKRLIGRKLEEISNHKRLSYKVRADAEGDVVLVCKNVEPGVLHPEEISAQVIAQLIADAEHHTGGEITKAVISVPAYFKDPQIQATIAAGKLAGLEKVRIIREPVAAALAYGLDLKEDQTVLVFDLGGGTYDISILEVGGGVIEVLSTGGDAFLGGDDWDETVVQWLIAEYLAPGGVDCKDPRIRANLKGMAEFAKIRLSDAKEVALRMPVGGKDGGPLDITLTRDKFEKMAAPLFKRCRPPLDNACWQAGVDLVSALDKAAGKLSTKGGGKSKKFVAGKPVLRPKKRAPVTKVLLVGGSTKMPAVKRLIKNMTGLEPLVKDVDADQAVALGAAIQAGMFQGEVSSLMVMDVWQSALLRAFAREKIKGDRQAAKQEARQAAEEIRPTSSTSLPSSPTSTTGSDGEATPGSPATVSPAGSVRSSQQSPHDPHDPLASSSTQVSDIGPAPDPSATTPPAMEPHPAPSTSVQSPPSASVTETQASMTDTPTGVGVDEGSTSDSESDGEEEDGDLPEAEGGQMAEDSAKPLNGKTTPKVRSMRRAPSSRRTKLSTRLGGPRTRP